MARTLLGFSRFPAAGVEPLPDQGVIVRWNDVRFAGGITRLGGTESATRSSFSAAVRLDRNGRIVAESLAGGRFTRSADE
jgi:hypothetical protein